VRDKQHLRQEHDPRVRRALVFAAAGAFGLILSGLAVVGLRVQQVHLGYQLDALRADRTRLGILAGQLEVELATLRSPARVETRARQLGFTVPKPRQIRIAREFVVGDGGHAAVDAGQVTASLPVSRAFVRRPFEP